MGKRAGFTIIEMLIVVAILAMLAGITSSLMEENQAKARDAKRAADLKILRAVLETHKIRTGSYPTTNGSWRGDCSAYGGYGYDNSGYIPGLVPSYLQSLPKDPGPAPSQADAGYLYRSDGRDFKFIIHRTPDDYPPESPYFDPVRPYQAWQISTPNAYLW
ncbi:MAG: prepilin-type N-terminal cleavage/methylation domain-containing protein [Planctomycetota bacterium]|nr:MAG: prepilin-type N-terminal cleavage/methylation domain-containing protein [Planctomycetota bacterium]